MSTLPDSINNINDVEALVEMLLYIDAENTRDRSLVSESDWDNWVKARTRFDKTVTESLSGIKSSGLITEKVKSDLEVVRKSIAGAKHVSREELEKTLHQSKNKSVADKLLSRIAGLAK